MKLHYFLFIPVFLFLSDVFSRDAVAIVHNTGEDPGNYSVGVDLIFASGQKKTVVNEKVKWACFSPDGRKIMYTQGSNMYIMDNNGNNKKQIATGLDIHDLIRVSWTTSGIFWRGDKNIIYRLDPETGNVSNFFNLDDISKEVCDDEGGWGLWCSADGRRMWLKTGLAAKDDGSIYCGVRGYSRGGRAYLQFSADFKSYDLVWGTEWGHGDGMTADGSLFLAKLGDHRLLYVTRQEGKSLKEIYPMWELNPPYSNECRNYGQCVNNDSILVSCLKFWNWHTKKLLGQFSNPSGDRYFFNMWDGKLPDPGAAVNSQLRQISQKRLASSSTILSPQKLAELAKAHPGLTRVDILNSAGRKVEAIAARHDGVYRPSFAARRGTYIVRGENANGQVLFVLRMASF